MWFPGSVLALEAEAHPPDGLQSLLRRCVETRLNGYLEISFHELDGIVLFHRGDAVNIVSRFKDAVGGGRGALSALAKRSRVQVGSARIHEMTEELAEMLRGLHGRVEAAPLCSSEQAKQVLESIKDQLDTGTVELHSEIGTAIVLFCDRRFVNCYLRTESGSTYESDEALREIFDYLDSPDGAVQVFTSIYSSERAKIRIYGNLFEELQRPI